MRMRVLRIKLRVEIENEMRVFLDSHNFEIEMRVSQKSDASITKMIAGLFEAYIPCSKLELKSLLV